MGVYVVTGASSGIGLEVKKILISRGHEVVNIDYRDGDILADLSRKEERQKAISEIARRYPEGLDGVIANAGVGPGAPAEMIFRLNYFASRDIIEGLRPLLKMKKGNAVVTVSNTITNNFVRQDWVDIMTNVNDEERVAELAATIPREAGAAVYASTKHALARYVRRLSASWATDGLRINAVAPGNTATQMTRSMTPAQMEAALLIPIPTRYGRKEFLDPDEIAEAICFLSSRAASGINGAILFVDGGIDALLRSERI